MTTIRIGLDLSEEPEIQAAIEDVLEDVRSGVSFEVERALQGSASKWPVDTGLSKRQFVAESTFGNETIEVRNTATSRGVHYPAIVENSERLRGGRLNPNHHAARSTIEQQADNIVRKTLDKIGD